MRPGAYPHRLPVGHCESLCRPLRAPSEFILELAGWSPREGEQTKTTTRKRRRDFFVGKYSGCYRVSLSRDHVASRGMPERQLLGFS